MFRRTFVAGLVGALGAALLALVPGPAAAAGGAGGRLVRAPSPLGDFADSNTRTLALAEEGDHKAAVLPDDWKVGDCVLKKGARVEFYKNGKFHFVGTAYTTVGPITIPVPKIGDVTVPRSGDVWHQYFIAKGPKGLRVQVKNQFRLPEKDDLPVKVDASVDEWQDYDASHYDQLTDVDWTGRC